MKKILKKVQKNHKLHSILRIFYGKTIGFWWFKDWFAKNVGFYNGGKRVKLLSLEKSERLIARKIISGKPFMLARYGSTELRTLFGEDVDTLCTYSGFFPNDDSLLEKFKEEYFKSSRKIDILAVWNYQNNFLNKIRWLRNFSNIDYLISAWAMDRESISWTKNLKGKKVLIIHPFEATIKKQYAKRANLKILPELGSLQVIKAVQTIAGNSDERFETWFDALEHMKNEIKSADFDIVLIGCGAYGLPLAAYAKSLGKQAVHVGGGLQLLFGIKGKRWEKSRNFNKHCIYPLDEDIPKNSSKVEGGCYWK